MEELRGSKEQLEQSLFTSQESLQQLQGEHEKVCVEYCEVELRSNDRKRCLCMYMLDFTLHVSLPIYLM